MQLDNLTERIIENAIELASDCLETLQDQCGGGRDVLISHFIIPWAVQAEEEYQKRLAVAEVPYYDFIMDYGARKLQEEIGHEAKSLVAG